jgi:hypothetical protein
MIGLADFFSTNQHRVVLSGVLRGHYFNNFSNFRGLARSRKLGPGDLYEPLRRWQQQ